MRIRGRQAVALTACLCGLLSTSSPAPAQATSGSITGRVTDPSHATVPRASVKARDEGTGLAQETSTNGSGEYTLAALPPGKYTFTISKQGFNAAVVTGVLLAIAETLRLHFCSEPADFSQHRG